LYVKKLLFLKFKISPIRYFGKSAKENALDREGAALLFAVIVQLFLIIIYFTVLVAIIILFV